MQLHNPVMLFMKLVEARLDPSQAFKMAKLNQVLPKVFETPHQQRVLSAAGTCDQILFAPAYVDKAPKLGTLWLERVLPQAGPTTYMFGFGGEVPQTGEARADARHRFELLSFAVPAEGAAQVQVPAGQISVEAMPLSYRIFLLDKALFHSPRIALSHARTTPDGKASVFN